MIRNKGFFIFAIVISVFALIGSVIISYFDIRAGIAALTFFGLINLSFIVFTKLRYNEIKKLSSYFYKIYTGGDVIDISDNSEGELSVLKGDIYKMTLALQEKNELLKKDRNYLADTLSNISHQLRTPLTSMFMMADFLSDPGLTQEKRDEFLNNLINQLKRIEWLVTSLLKLSKIDANAVEFKKERITAEKLLKKSLAPMMIPIEIKDINLEIAGDKNIEMILDINWTTEAMINIIKNCVEHTSEGGNIKIEAQRHGDLLSDYCFG